MAEAESATAGNKGHGLLCPACRVDLVMSDRQGIEIDYCPKCRGVWLDRGELDKLIERSAGAEAQGARGQPYPSREPGYDSHHGGHGGSHGYRGKHGSFLGRLFD